MGFKNLVLDLKTHDPYEMGFAHGYLLAPQISDFADRALRPMFFLCRLLKGDFRGKRLKGQIQNITIPSGYQTELDGLVAGVAASLKVKTDDSIILRWKRDLAGIHRLSDVYKAIGCQALFGLKWLNFTLGCSTAIIKSGSSITVGRNLDWLSLGMMGSTTILRRSTTPTGKKIEMYTVPGFIGALTAKNSSGLITIINESGSHSGSGVPYHIIARQIVEKYDTVSAAKNFIDQLPAVSRPASSHHLIIVDRQMGIDFQFYAAGAEQYYLPRKLDQDGILVVTNHAVEAVSEKTIPGSVCDFTSKKRFKRMSETLILALKEGVSPKKAMIRGLHSVSNTATTGTALYFCDGMESEAHYVSSNFFSADYLDENFIG